MHLPPDFPAEFDRAIETLKQKFESLCKRMRMLEDAKEADKHAAAIESHLDSQINKMENQ